MANGCPLLKPIFDSCFFVVISFPSEHQVPIIAPGEWQRSAVSAKNFGFIISFAEI